MSKITYTASTLDDLQKSLEGFVARVKRLKKSMSDAKASSFKLDFEQRKARGLSDLKKWFDEAEIHANGEVLRVQQLAEK